MTFGGRWGLVGELVEEERILEELPSWVPGYLAAWGSQLDPDGKTMRVKTAAALAGTTESNVRMLRKRNQNFRLLETIARKGGSLWLSSYMEAGIRGMAPRIFQSFYKLVEAENPQVVLQAMKWALDKPDAIDITSAGDKLEQSVVVYIPDNDRGDRDLTGDEGDDG